MFKVMIDPGHGPGNTNRGPTGYFEHNGMWILSSYLKEILESKGVQADLTRAKNEDPDLKVRGIQAQGYDLFISEHSNAGGGKGVEAFYDFTKLYDKVNAEKLSKAVAEVMNSADRGAKVRTYVEKGIKENYYGILRNANKTECKHIFLIENGFHDNAEDEAFLKADENLKKIAQVQADVICEVLGVKNMTLEEAEKIVQEKAKLDNNTMQYLKFYKYGEDLIKKLAEPMK